MEWNKSTWKLINEGSKKVVSNYARNLTGKNKEHIKKVCKIVIQV